MKHFAVLIFCIIGLVAALPIQEDPEDSNELAANNKKCIEQTGVSLEQIEELRKNPTSEMPKPGMCYIKCMAELSGLEKNGLIQKGIAVVKRPEGIAKKDAEKLIEDCSKLDADDPCERSFVKYICVFEKSEGKAWLKTE